MGSTDTSRDRCLSDSRSRGRSDAALPSLRHRRHHQPHPRLWLAHADACASVLRGRDGDPGSLTLVSIPSSMLSCKPSSAAFAARFTSPCHCASHPLAFSALALAVADAGPCLASTASSHLPPSPKSPLLSQHSPSAVLSRSPSSASPCSSDHERAALKLSCSASSRSSHCPCRCLFNSSSASSARARKKAACRFSTASASPLSSSFSRRYCLTGSSRL